MFDKAAGRWIAPSFGSSVSDLQVAISAQVKARLMCRERPFHAAN